MLNGMISCFDNVINEHWLKTNIVDHNNKIKGRDFEGHQYSINDIARFLSIDIFSKKNTNEYLYYSTSVLNYSIRIDDDRTIFDFGSSFDLTQINEPKYEIEGYLDFARENIGDFGKFCIDYDNFSIRFNNGFIVDNPGSLNKQARMIMQNMINASLFLPIYLKNEEIDNY